MKIFLTGAKGIGKSTCVKEVIEECQLSICGFMTLPFYEDGQRVGFLMHALLPQVPNDVRFSKGKTVIPHVFDTFGVDVLTNCLNYPQRTLILDEIGFLERHEHHYLQQLWQCIDSFENIIGVLRKCDENYIIKIRERKDVVVYDLDILDYQEVKKCIIKEVEGLL